MCKKVLLIMTAATMFLLVVATGGWAVVPPPPVNQNFGFLDQQFSDFLEADCRFCHNQNPPTGIPVDPTYLPDRHHLNVGATIPVGTCSQTLNACNVDADCPVDATNTNNYCVGESEVPKPDADGDNVADITYDCLNCHNVEFDPVLGSYVIIEDFRDCTGCHNVDFQPEFPDRTQEPNQHHRASAGDGAARAGNCAFCHGSVVDSGLADTTGDGFADTIVATWVPTYDPSLVTPWPSGKEFGSCWVEGACSVTTTTSCLGDADCPAGETCNGAVDTTAFCAGDEANYCQPGETCVPDGATYGGGGDPNARLTQEGNCNFCHDASQDPAVAFCDETGPSPVCSAGSSNAGAACGKDADCNGPILINHDTHHFTGVTGLEGTVPALKESCFWCHQDAPFGVDGFALPQGNARDIRACETCHGIPSLHNIQTDSDGSCSVTTTQQCVTDNDCPANETCVTDIQVGAEAFGYGHIGSNADCNGCHGFEAPTLQALAPQSGPVIPFIGSADDLGTEAGTATTVTLGGVAFTNVTMGMDYTSEAVLDGSSDNLAVSVTGSEMVVNLPGLAAGTHMLRAKKYQKLSNPAVIVVTPQVAVDSVTCADGAATISGSGFSSYLEASNSPTGVTGDVTTMVGKGKKKKPVTNNETAAISSWNDTQIEAQFSACPDDGTVAVSTVWDITGGSEPPEPPDPPTEPEICDDGVDNDGDGKTDCADKKDCRKDPAC